MAELQGSPLRSSAWLCWGIGTRGQGLPQLRSPPWLPLAPHQPIFQAQRPGLPVLGPPLGLTEQTGSVETIRPFPERPEFPWTSAAFEPVLPRLILEAQRNDRSWLRAP